MKYEHDPAPDHRNVAEPPGASRSPLVSVVIPCLNEADTIEECVRRARDVCAANKIDGEIIVVDNGSTDGSGHLAAGAGAVVVNEPERGYGSAYMAGFWPGARALHRDGRRRPDLRLRRDPPLSGRAGKGRRHGDRQPDEEHPSRRDAVAPPLHRQPAAFGLPEPSVPHRHRRRPLRHARAARQMLPNSRCAPRAWSSPPRW